MSAKSKITTDEQLRIKAGDHITTDSDIYTYTATVLGVSPTGKTIYCTRFNCGSCFPWEQSYDKDVVKKAKIRIRTVDYQLERIEQKYNLNGNHEARETIGYRYRFAKKHYDHLIERVFWNGHTWEHNPPLHEPGEILYFPIQENCSYL